MTASGARRSLPGGLIGQGGPFVLLAAAAGYLALRWHELPARIPVHWDLAGHPSRLIARSVLGVFGSFLIGGLILAVTLLSSYGILRWSPRLRSVGEPGRHDERFRTANLVILLVAEYLTAILFAGVGLLPLLKTGALLVPAVLLLSGPAILIAIAIILARMGRGGTRPTSEPNAAPAGGRTSDAFWRAGIFYFNAGDPAVFVEKRFGIGYTLNFARRRAWMILALLILGPLVIALLALR